MSLITTNKMIAFNRETQIQKTKILVQYSKFNSVRNVF